MRIRVNDTVEVIRGEDRGQRGRVLRVEHGKNHVVVEGINTAIKHVRRSARNPQGRLSRDLPISAARVMLVCPACGARTRIGARRLDDGSKVRYCKKCNANIGEISPAPRS